MMKMKTSFDQSGIDNLLYLILIHFLCKRKKHKYFLQSSWDFFKLIFTILENKGKI